MDLKEFIKETVAAIVDATSELQVEYESKGVIVNPPVSVKERDLYEHGNTTYRYRRVETIEFDVAVTAASETMGGAKAGLRIFAAEVGADGSHARNHEEVSRVKFSIPIVLSPADIERTNKDNAAAERQKSQDAMKSGSTQGQSSNSWMRR